MIDIDRMTPGEIKRANFWIRRWKMIGGGFQVHDLPEAFVIQPVRAADPDAKHDAAFAKAESALLDELEKNHKKKGHVFDLVRAAHGHRQKEDSIAKLEQGQAWLEGEQAEAGADDPPEAA